METPKTQAETTIQDGATFKIDGNWNEQAKALQKDGKEEELLKRVETRLSKSRKEVIELITKAQSAEKQN
jgi:hypothetical protein